jgi:hypothetical protein
MRRSGFVWLLIAFGVYLAPTGGSVAEPPETKPQNAEAETLRAAPNAPAPTPEAQPNPGAAGERADICQELVAFVQKMAVDPGKPQGAPPAGDSPPSKPGGDAPQQRSGISGPVPHDDTGSKRATLSLEEAQSLAGARDVRGCRQAAQRMRRAGVALPPGLLALAALREDLLLGEFPQPAR